MKQTRRGFVGGAAALGAILPWTTALAQAHPTRQSLTSFSRDPAKAASLRRGVAAMKARAPSDPKSWFFQSAIHAYNDAAYADALARDPAVAQVDARRFWNKCPHFGQSSAEFLIWHRAYLYNFERILREEAGDPMLALPYWDYSKPEGREFPQIFANEFLDAAQRVPNPLYHPNRESAFVTGRFDISDQVGEARATMAAPAFFSDVGRPGFAGRYSRQPAHATGFDRTAAAQRHPHRRRRRHRQRQRRHGGYPDGCVRSRLLGASRQYRSLVGGMVVHAGQELGADAAGCMARRSAVGIHRCRRQHHARKPAFLHRAHQHRRVLRHRQDARPADVPAAARCDGRRAAASAGARRRTGERSRCVSADAIHGDGRRDRGAFERTRASGGCDAGDRVAEIPRDAEFPAGAWRGH